MEALAAVGLAASVLQFVDFASKVIKDSSELFKSSKGILAENEDLEAATEHLVFLNGKIKDAAIAASDDRLARLSKACHATADELVKTLNSLRASGKASKWTSLSKALQSVWKKEKIQDLEARLSRFRDELNLHVLVDLRYVMCLLLHSIYLKSVTV